MTIGISLASILAHIVTDFGNTELNFISDFKSLGKMSYKRNKLLLTFFISEQTKLLSGLAALTVPVWQYELHALRERQENEFLPQDCPIIQKRFIIH